jgi:hypothetical protein
MNNKHYRGLAFAAGVATLASMIAAPLMAAAATSSNAVDVSITPLIREVSSKPGDTFTGSIEVKNESDAKQTFFPAARDFTSSTDTSTGAPKFLETAGTAAQSLSSWTTFSKSSYDVDSKGSATIDYTVKVPASAEPGGHYSGIFASTQAPDVSGGSGVAIAARVGSLLMVTVAGDITTKAEVQSFTSSQSIYQNGPFTFTANLKNTGNIHFKPKGTINVKNGSKVESIQFNVNGGNVLPSSARDFTEKLDGTFGFGRYTATLDVTAVAPNGDQIPLTSVVSFWVIPMSTVLITLLILIVLYLILKTGMKGNNSYKKTATK